MELKLIFILFCFRQHIHQHAQDTNHYLAMDLSFGQTYCFLCQDYIYDKEVESIAQVNTLHVLLMQLRVTYIEQQKIPSNIAHVIR